MTLKPTFHQGSSFEMTLFSFYFFINYVSSKCSGSTSLKRTFFFPFHNDSRYMFERFFLRIKRRNFAFGLYRELFLLIFFLKHEIFHSYRVHIYTSNKKQSKEKKKKKVFTSCYTCNFIGFFLGGKKRKNQFPNLSLSLSLLNFIP